MLKRIIINLICFAYNWFLIGKVRYRNYIMDQRIKYVVALKRRYK